MVASLTKLRKIEESSAVLATRNDERIAGCKMGCCIMAFLLHTVFLKLRGKSRRVARPEVYKRAVFSSLRLHETLG